jgi:hypothetical protein
MYVCWDGCEYFRAVTDFSTFMKMQVQSEGDKLLKKTASGSGKKERHWSFRQDEREEVMQVVV